MIMQAETTSASVPQQSTAPAPLPALVPRFVGDVYAVSPYGDFALMNKLYYATAETAFALAQRYGALPVLLSGTPECPQPARFAVVQIPARSPLLPSPGMRQEDANKVLLAMDLPPFRQWALKWPKFVTNAGRLADYYRRCPEAQFPGLADHYCRILLQGDGVQL